MPFVRPLGVPLVVEDVDAVVDRLVELADCLGLEDGDARYFTPDVDRKILAHDLLGSIIREILVEVLALGVRDIHDHGRLMTPGAFAERVVLEASRRKLFHRRRPRPRRERFRVHDVVEALAYYGDAGRLGMVRAVDAERCWVLFPDDAGWYEVEALDVWPESELADSEFRVGDRVVDAPPY